MAGSTNPSTPANSNAALMTPAAANARLPAMTGIGANDDKKKEREVSSAPGNFQATSASGNQFPFDSPQSI